MRRVCSGDDAPASEVTPKSPGAPADPGALFLAGVVLALGVAGLVGAAAVVDRTLFAAILAVIAAAFVGGRIPGILTSLEVGFEPPMTVFLLILLNTTWLFLVVPLFIGLQQRFSGSRWTTRLVRSTRHQAEERVSIIDSLGSIGLPLFVWLPFPFTGALVGAVIGLLLGMSLRHVLWLVLASMWVGVITWTYGIEYVVLITGPAGKVAFWSVAAAFILYSLIRRPRER